MQQIHQQRAHKCALDRQVLSCTYLAHHDLESIISIITIIDRLTNKCDMQYAEQGLCPAPSRQILWVPEHAVIL